MNILNAKTGENFELKDQLWQLSQAITDQDIQTLILSKFVHSINIVGTLYLMSRNVDFGTSILQLNYYKNNF